AVGSTGWTPLVGREQEIKLLLERWAQVKEGVGQVVLLRGEAGIGKSRLVQVLKEHVATEPQAWLTPCQCSPYFQNTALYPMIDLLERVALQFDREEMPQQKLSKLEGFLVQYGLPLAETVPLFASLLSLPLGTDYAPLTVSPEQQKQRTLQALLTILLRIAAQQPLLFVMEDLHWVDPTTVEFLSLLVDQGPTARILALFTLRPDFSPPWTGRAHLTQITLNRLPRRQAAEMTARVAHGKVLPAEVLEQVVAKTDSVRRLGPRRPHDGDCPGWWTPSWCISGACRRRSPTRSSMRSSRTLRISPCCGAPVSSITSALHRCWLSSFQRRPRRSPSCWRSTTLRQA